MIIYMFGGLHSFAIIALQWEKHIFTAWTMNCKSAKFSNLQNLEPNSSN